MGRPKQLLPFRGSTVIECIVDSALKTSLSKVVVVLGHRADELRPLLEKRDVTVVINPEYKRGQSSSIQVGLDAVRQDVDAVLFLLGDQPLITPETIDCLISAYASSSGPIVMPLFNGKRGNPVLFDRQTFERIDALKGDTGARVLFQEYAEQIVEVPFHDPSVRFDIDTEQDYLLLKKME
jgi:molybdenum cofactor cytidylyltransferase